MKKKVLTSILMLSTVSFARETYHDINIVNSCEGIKVTQIKAFKANPYGSSNVVGIKYGLKNTTDKLVNDIKITTYLKDKDGHRIYEDDLVKHKSLKPHYEDPFDDSRYSPVGEAIPSSFSGKIDFEISCDTTKKKHKSDKTIDISQYKNIKLDNLQDKLSFYMILKIVDEIGGPKKFLEKMSKCVKEQK